MFRRLWSSPRFHRWGIPLLIFLLAFLPRVIYPVSRPLVWTDRAFHFGQAILDGDWATTYQRYHPGVTIMWLSGIGLHLFSIVRGGLTPDQMIGVAPTPPGTLSASLTAAIIPVALVIALAVALTYPLLRRLAGKKIALTAAVLLALDPFSITYSKVVHPDGLLAMFMLLSALLLLLYLRERRLLFLLLSGAMGGLALLSKTPAIFLLPYAGLLLSATAFFPLLGERRFDPGEWVGRAFVVARRLLVWLAVAVFIFVILWPAMWVKPHDVVARMAEKLTYHTEEAHPSPVFFNGEIHTDDPGPLFYVATLAWKSTIITLPGLLLALLFLLRYWRTAKGATLMALVAYAFFYFLQMSLGAYKQIAYILPVGPVLVLIAAFGLVWAGEWLSRRTRRPTLALALFLGIVMLVHLGLVLRYHPYLGTHYNTLLGGVQVARHVLPLQDQGEGLDLAARYLSQLPHGQDETATLHPRGVVVFQREFIGRTAKEYLPWATYRVYGVNEVMRHMNEGERLAAWEADRQTTPLHTISFDGVPYVWIYGEMPSDPTGDAPWSDVSYQVGEHFHLHSYSLSQEVVAPGASLALGLLWSTDSQVDQEYVVFNHLLSAGHTLAAQKDNVPLNGIRPTFTWLPGEQLEDAYYLTVGEDVPPGVYEWSAGMYDAQTLQRLPAYNAAGERLPEDRIPLGTIRVEVRDATSQIE